MSLGVAVVLAVSSTAYARGARHPANSPPPAPTNLKADQGDAEVSLKWGAAAGATQYKIRRSTTSGSGYTEVGTSSGPSFLDSALTNGTSYFYVVIAVDAANAEGPASNEASATPREASKTRARNFLDFVSIINGFVLLTPYRIQETAAGPPPTFQLETAADTEVRYFIEAELSFRDAWLDRDDKEPLITKIIGSDYNDVVKWLGPLKLFPDDYDFQLGYVAGSSSEASGATLLGSGEGFTEIQVGWNFGGVHKIRRQKPDEDVRVTLNTELVFGAVSDRSAQKVHEYWKVGLAGVWDIPIDDQENTISAIAGVYVGKSDVPKLAATPGVAEVQTDHGFPEFEKRKVVALRGEINIPLQIGTVFIAGEFNSISGSEFASEPWEIAMGIAIPLTRVAALFGYDPNEGGE